MLEIRHPKLITFGIGLTLALSIALALVFAGTQQAFSTSHALDNNHASPSHQGLAHMSDRAKLNLFDDGTVCTCDPPPGGGGGSPI